MNSILDGKGQQKNSVYQEHLSVASCSVMWGQSDWKKMCHNLDWITSNIKTHKLTFASPLFLTMQLIVEMHFNGNLYLPIQFGSLCWNVTHRYMFRCEQSKLDSQLCRVSVKSVFALVVGGPNQIQIISIPKLVLVSILGCLGWCCSFSSSLTFSSRLCKHRSCRILYCMLCSSSSFVLLSCDSVVPPRVTLRETHDLLTTDTIIHHSREILLFCQWKYCYLLHENTSAGKSIGISIGNTSPIFTYTFVSDGYQILHNHTPLVCTWCLRTCFCICLLL